MIKRFGRNLFVNMQLKLLNQGLRKTHPRQKVNFICIFLVPWKFRSQCLNEIGAATNRAIYAVAWSLDLGFQSLVVDNNAIEH